MATGTVKFFNGEKGFGFIAPEGGGTDIFVHISAVQRAGLDGLSEGDQVSFEVEQDRRSGKSAASELRLLAGGGGGGRSSPRSEGRSDRFGGGGGGYGDRGGGGYGDRGGGGYGDRGGGGYGGGEPRRDSAPSGGPGSGVVKWFNQTKGFGFIRPNDGGADIFVHISAVEQAGLHGLDEGQPVDYELETDRRSGKTSAVRLRVGH